MLASPRASSCWPARSSGVGEVDTGMAIISDPLRLVIGDKAAKRLDEAFGMRTVGDLLRHYPRRYANRGELTSLTGLRDGEHVTVMAEVAAVSSRPMRNRRGSIFEAVVTDGHGRLTLTFFGRGRQDWREDVRCQGGRVRGRADPDLPRDRQDRLVADR